MYLLRLFSSVNVDDLVLIHIFKDVWGIHQDANSANRCDKEEHVELQAIDHHSHKLPVSSDTLLHVFTQVLFWAGNQGTPGPLIMEKFALCEFRTM